MSTYQTRKIEQFFLEPYYVLFFFSLSAVLMPLFYFFMLFETCCSQTDDYVTNKLNLEQAEEKIQKVRKVCSFLQQKLLTSLQEYLWS